MPQLEILQGTLGCDPQFKSVVQNRSASSRLGLLHGYLGCGIVESVLEGKKRQERRIERKADKTANEIKVIYAKANAASGNIPGQTSTSSPINMDTITDKLSSFFQNQTGGSNTGVAIPPAQQTGQQQNPPPADDGQIFGMDKTTAMIAGAGVLTAAYFIFKK